MEPIFFDDDPLLIDTTKAPALDDFVAVWRRRELVRPGEHQIIVKRLLCFGKINEAESVMLEMLNPQVRIVLPLSGIEAIHTCLGRVPNETKRVKFTDEEFLPSEARRAPVCELEVA